MKPPPCLSGVSIGIFATVVLLPIVYMLGAPFLGGGLDRTDGGNPLFDPRQLWLAARSLAIAAGTTILALIMGVPTAILLSRTDLGMKQALAALAVVPVLIPPSIHAIVWSHLDRLAKPVLPLNIHSLWGVILVLALAYFPFVFLLTTSGLQTIDPNVEEASLLNRGRFRTVTRITLPLATPHILSSAVFVFIFSVIDFGVPDILRVNVYPVEIFIQFSALYDEKSATLLSLPLLLMTLSLLLLHQRIMKERSFINFSGGHARRVVFGLGNLGFAAHGFILLILILSVGVPLAVLLHAAGPIAGYGRVLQSCADQIAYSLIVALAGALLAVALGFPLAIIMERSPDRPARVLFFCALLPLAVPAVTLGIGMIKVWNRPFVDLLYGSSLMVVFGYTARFLPLCVLAAISGLKQIGTGPEEAAALVTSRWSRTAGNILLPLMSRSLTTGFFAVFVLSLGELGTTLLVIPPGRETIPIRIYNLMHYGAEQTVAALCLIVVGTVLGFWLLFLGIRGRLPMVDRS